MIPDEIDMELLVAFAQEAMQKASYEISDLINRWPDQLRVFWLASAQGIINALLQCMDDADRGLFDSLVANLATVMLPPAFDPRKRDEQ